MINLSHEQGQSKVKMHLTLLMPFLSNTVFSPPFVWFSPVRAINSFYFKKLNRQTKLIVFMTMFGDLYDWKCELKNSAFREIFNSYSV